MQSKTSLIKKQEACLFGYVDIGKSPSTFNNEPLRKKFQLATGDQSTDKNKSEEMFCSSELSKIKKMQFI